MIQGRFQHLAGLLQLLRNRNLLRAVRNAFAAADAVGGTDRVFSHESVSHVFLSCDRQTFGRRGIIAGEGARNVHAGRAGLTVAAAGAGYQGVFSDDSENLITGWGVSTPSDNETVMDGSPSNPRVMSTSISLHSFLTDKI